MVGMSVDPALLEHVGGSLSMLDDAPVRTVASASGSSVVDEAVQAAGEALTVGASRTSTLVQAITASTLEAAAVYRETEEAIAAMSEESSFDDSGSSGGSGGGGSSGGGSGGGQYSVDDDPGAEAPPAETGAVAGLGGPSVGAQRYSRSLSGMRYRLPEGARVTGLHGQLGRESGLGAGASAHQTMGHTAPAHTGPMHTTPGHFVPGHGAPGHTMIGQATPTHPSPSNATPAGHATAGLNFGDAGTPSSAAATSSLGGGSSPASGHAPVAEFRASDADPVVQAMRIDRSEWAGDPA